MKRLRVPEYAKRNARKALRRRASLPESERFGLSKSEAKEKGVFSGVRRAEQLIRSDSISESDAKRVCAFKRFFGMERTSKVKGSINLWGGERFIKKACEFLKE